MTSKKDLFGFSETPNEPDEGDDDDGVDEISYIVLQIIPAVGWRAIFVDDANNERMQPLACFALVEIPQPLPEPPVETDTPIDMMPVRTVRPMVAAADGSIEDVESFDDFLLIAGPDDAEGPIPDNLNLRARITMAIAARTQQD
jgi:hypothetical protein